LGVALVAVRWSGSCFSSGLVWSVGGVGFFSGGLSRVSPAVVGAFLFAADGGRIIGAEPAAVAAAVEVVVVVLGVMFAVVVVFEGVHGLRTAVTSDTEMGTDGDFAGFVALGVVMLPKVPGASVVVASSPVGIRVGVCFGQAPLTLSEQCDEVLLRRHCPEDEFQPALVFVEETRFLQVL